MQHTHRLELRITVPRRGPIGISLDAQDVMPAEPVRADKPADSIRPVASNH